MKQLSGIECRRCLSVLTVKHRVYRCVWSVGHPADGSTVFAYHLCRTSSGLIEKVWTDKGDRTEEFRNRKIREIISRDQGDLFQTKEDERD